MRASAAGTCGAGLLEGKRVSRVSTTNWSPTFCNTPEFAQASRSLYLAIG
ncbi:hypothetical protein [Streptomyces candidus]|uniref:Uncharacterized protein n=1 Tax=Streptomyces candidus TaxID=67283 RepID=A0A7X0HNA1_9ACTN|nr:hypothetical protein [Streptomyces candidus]MBB6439492.1 hypothetical protein [Streptomyces candidus]